MIFRRGANLINRVMSRSGSVEITYVRNGDIAINIESATVGESTHQWTDDLGNAIEFVSRDYVFPASTLTTGSGLITPKRGDRITQTIEGVDYSYEVIYQPGISAWRYTGSTNNRIRVHTKLISTD